MSNRWINLDSNTFDSIWKHNQDFWVYFIQGQGPIFVFNYYNYFQPLQRYFSTCVKIGYSPQIDHGIYQFYIERQQKYLLPCKRMDSPWAAVRQVLNRSGILKTLKSLPGYGASRHLGVENLMGKTGHWHIYIYRPLLHKFNFCNYIYDAYLRVQSSVRCSFVDQW